MATRWVTTRRGDDMPNTRKRQLPQGEESTGPAHGPEQTNRDALAYERAWFADFRERFRRDLTDARYAGHLNRLEV